MYVELRLRHMTPVSVIMTAIALAAALHAAILDKCKTNSIGVINDDLAKVHIMTAS